jgi:hypothetical protein
MKNTLVIGGVVVAVAVVIYFLWQSNQTSAANAAAEQAVANNTNSPAIGSSLGSGLTSSIANALAGITGNGLTSLGQIDDDFGNDDDDLDVLNEPGLVSSPVASPSPSIPVYATEDWD